MRHPEARGRLLPIAQLPGSEARHLRGLLFDVDDTLLDRGRLTEAAYSALWAARRSGLELVAVTGRPSEWGRLLCRQWPVDAVVAENGAVSWVCVGDRPTLFDRCSSAERAARSQRLHSLVEELTRTVPELVLSDDVRGRLSDVTFDIGEYRRLDAAVLERALVQAESLGLTTSTSSVHLHVSLDSIDKSCGALGLAERLFGVDVARAKIEYAYIGDSENDSSCFATFSTTIGVANLSRGCTPLPRYLTREQRGLGFAEAVGVLLAARVEAR